MLWLSWRDPSLDPGGLDPRVWKWFDVVSSFGLPNLAKTWEPQHDGDSAGEFWVHYTLNILRHSKNLQSLVRLAIKHSYSQINLYTIFCVLPYSWTKSGKGQVASGSHTLSEVTYLVNAPPVNLWLYFAVFGRYPRKGKFYKHCGGQCTLQNILNLSTWRLHSS